MAFKVTKANCLEFLIKVWTNFWALWAPAGRPSQFQKSQNIFTFFLFPIKKCEMKNVWMTHWIATIEAPLESGWRGVRPEDASLWPGAQEFDRRLKSDLGEHPKPESVDHRQIGPSSRSILNLNTSDWSYQLCFLMGSCQIMRKEEQKGPPATSIPHTYEDQK
mgnify:CR=1 FL=1